MVFSGFSKVWQQSLRYLKKKAQIRNTDTEVMEFFQRPNASFGHIIGLNPSNFFILELISNWGHAMEGNLVADALEYINLPY